MPRSRLPLRLILLAALAIGVAVVAGLVIGTVNGLLEFYDRVAHLPLALRLPLVVALTLFAIALGVLVWRLARPAPKRAPKTVPTRARVEDRISDLRARHADTAALERELVELDRRHACGECYVALFGEISTGKSSLIRALAPAAAPEIDVRGGTTHGVDHYRGRLSDGRELILADVPGSHEISGTAREALARDEALRAHAVIYACASDLTRAQNTELRWLADFGKPLLLVLNKIDLYSEAERAALEETLRRRYLDCAQAVIAVSAGGLEHYERTLPDGRRERVERERVPDVAALTAALERLTALGAVALEPARAAAVLARVDARGAELARAAAAEEAEQTVARYTRRAIIGALAAVAPGSDIVIQGVLATALVRELARIHGVAVREIDIDALLARLGGVVRNAATIVLAIAGNVLKAFPGLGTLGGGALHAIAYGLVFDSLGRALSATLAERAALDEADTERRVRELLSAPGRERIERVARLVFDIATESSDVAASPPD